MEKRSKKERKRIFELHVNSITTPWAVPSSSPGPWRARRLVGADVDSRVWLASTRTYIASAGPFMVWIHSRLGGWVELIKKQQQTTTVFNFHRSEWLLLLLSLYEFNSTPEPVSRPWREPHRNVSRPWREPHRRYKSELRPTKHESPQPHYRGAAHAKAPRRGMVQMPLSCLTVVCWLSSHLLLFSKKRHVKRKKGNHPRSSKPAAQHMYKQMYTYTVYMYTVF